VGNFLVREGCFKFGGAPGRVREGVHPTGLGKGMVYWLG